MADSDVVHVGAFVGRCSIGRQGSELEGAA